MASQIGQIKFSLRIKPSILLPRQPKRLSLISALNKKCTILFECQLECKNIKKSSYLDDQKTSGLQEISSN